MFSTYVNSFKVIYQLWFFSLLLQLPGSFPFVQGACFHKVCCLRRPLGRADAAQHPFFRAHASCIRGRCFISIPYRCGHHRGTCRNEFVCTRVSTPRSAADSCPLVNRATGSREHLSPALLSQYMSFSSLTPPIFAIFLTQYGLPCVLAPAG